MNVLEIVFGKSLDNRLGGWSFLIVRCQSATPLSSRILENALGGS